MNKNLLALAISVTVWASAHADSTVNGPMAFDPISASAYAQQTVDPAVLNSEPWVIPNNFSQSIVSDESDLDIYPGLPDLTDMITANETRKHAGRFLYRTHEMRPRPGSDLTTYTGGALSVINAKTGKAKLLIQRKDWEALDGLVWTPWHSLLFAEETSNQAVPDPKVPNALRGLLYELSLDQKDPTKAAKVKVRPLLGSIAHEGIEIDAEGNVYVIDENATGAIYKFVPRHYGDLSRGQLYALKVDDTASGDRTGPAKWLPLEMAKVVIDARTAAADVGATTYGRPEDLERIGNTLYVAITSEARVLSITLGKHTKVRNFVKSGANAPVEDAATSVTGFKSPDNLANGPDGKLWIVEDNVPSDIWVAEPDNDGDGYSDGVDLFASLKDNAAEGSGIYFGKDPHTLYVNIQHSATGNDKTMAITNRKSKDDDDDSDQEDDKHERKNIKEGEHKD